MPAIRVTDLSKQYRLGPTYGATYRTLRESLGGVATRSWQRLTRPVSRSNSADRSSARPSNMLWALRDVSFDIPAGEVVGIIGGNGAGKSTLLKILSRITEPTAGRVEIRGRVGSLLEVGTGFHNELTGAENIFLSGAILGMTRREITRKFDDIVSFAEVKQFLDTPVKRYSSGMYVRLAFAVAAHLEPEVLIVDEVLAVGDAQFQKKCLGKMEDISRGGRTVFFVSHNMSVVQRLCNHVLFLHKGRLVGQGAKEALVARYLAEGFDRLEPGAELDLSGASRKGTREAHFAALRYASDRPALAQRPYPSGPLAFTVAIESDVARTVSSLGITLCHPHGVKLVNADTLALGQTLELRKGRNEVTLRFDRLPLNPGMYTVALWLANPGLVLDYIESALQLEVVEPDGAAPGVRPGFDGCVPCSFTVDV